MWKLHKKWKYWQMPLEIKCNLKYTTLCQESCNSCNDGESKRYISLQNSAFYSSWSFLCMKDKFTRTIQWQYNKETMLNYLAQPDLRQEKSQNNRKIQFQSKTVGKIQAQEWNNLSYTIIIAKLKVNLHFKWYQISAL